MKKKFLYQMIYLFLALTSLTVKSYCSDDSDWDFAEMDEKEKFVSIVQDQFSGNIHGQTEATFKTKDMHDYSKKKPIKKTKRFTKKRPIIQEQHNTIKEIESKNNLKSTSEEFGRKKISRQVTSEYLASIEAARHRMQYRSMIARQDAMKKSPEPETKPTSQQSLTDFINWAFFNK